MVGWQGIQINHKEITLAQSIPAQFLHGVYSNNFDFLCAFHVLKYDQLNLR